ncbi:MAG: hypothetical protein P8Y54_09195 [Xanthomonadales bacterium]
MLWLPRILLILFALFLTVFSLDVFREGLGAGDIAVGLAIHNIPTFLLLILVAAAWRREWLGALGCIVFAVLYLAWAVTRLAPVSYLPIALPLFLIAAVYAVSWRRRRAGR